LTAFGDHLAVDLLQRQAVNQVARQEQRIARADDDHLAQHLADDDLEMLVVDVDTLGAVDLLDLGQDVEAGRFQAHHLQNAVGVLGALIELRANLDQFAFCDQQASSGGDLVGTLVAPLVGNAHEQAFAPHDALVAGQDLLPSSCSAISAPASTRSPSST
jgi:hypothetical protein